MVQSALVAGARIRVRDAEWVVGHVSRSATSSAFVHATCISGIVSDKEAIFVEAIENTRGHGIQVVDPVGGMVPLGYDTNERRITVNEAEADRVRIIFRSYLKLGSLNLLMTDLRKQGIVTKLRTLKTGETVGGMPFSRGPLAHLLRNRFYIGEVPFKGEVLHGFRAFQEPGGAACAFVNRLPPRSGAE